MSTSRSSWKRSFLFACTVFGATALSCDSVKADLDLLYTPHAGSQTAAGRTMNRDSSIQTSANGALLAAARFDEVPEKSEVKTIDAATPEEAVKLIEIAIAKQDWDTVFALLADPVGPVLQDIRVTAKKMDDSWNNYQVSKKAHPGSFPDQSPKAPPTDMEEQQPEEKRTLIDVKIVRKTDIPDSDGVLSIKVQVRYENDQHDQQLATHTYMALSKNRSWKLVPEPLYVALQDDKEAETLVKLVNQTLSTMDDLRKKIDTAIAAMESNKPVDESKLLAAWKKVLENYGSPEMNPNDLKSYADFLAKGFIYAMLDEEASAPIPAPK